MLIAHRDTACAFLFPFQRNVDNRHDYQQGADDFRQLKHDIQQDDGEDDGCQGLCGVEDAGFLGQDVLGAGHIQPEGGGSAQHADVGKAQEGRYIHYAWV